MLMRKIQQFKEKFPLIEIMRWYIFTFIGIFIFLAVMLLPDNKEIFFNLMKDLGLLIAGGFGGYGLHAYRSGKRDK